MPAIYIICIMALLLAIYGFIETTLLKTTTFDIFSEAVPTAYDNKRIVLLSDLHCISFGKENSKLIKRVRDASPDMIIIAGDVINRNSKDFKYARDLLEGLKSLDIPVYYSFGNHESRLENSYYGKGLYEEYKSLCAKDVHLLINGSEELDKDCAVYGLTLPNAQFRLKLKYGLLKPVEYYLGKPDKERYNILIAHDPSYIEDYLDWGAHLVLSGHLHGGMVRLPGLGGLISPRYTLFPKPDKGLYMHENGKAHVISGGTGWHSIPIRFLNRPEVVVIDLHHKS